MAAPSQSRRRRRTKAPTTTASSRSLTSRSVALRLAVAATPLYVGACAVPDGGLFRAVRFRDVRSVYHGYAEAVFDGRVPYRDFFMEYPPGALAVFLPPAAAGSNAYGHAFKALMALCGAATLVLVALLLAQLGASRARLAAALALLALSPIAIGPIWLNTYDAWPALLTVAALALLIASRHVAAFAVLALAFTAKVYPLVFLLPALVFVWRTAGRAVAVRAAGAFAAVSALVVLPFLALAPDGLAESFRAQAGRALQVESLAASLLAVADQLGLYSASVVHRTGRAVSYDVVGSLPDALATASSVLQVLAVLVVAWLYMRGGDEPARLAIAFAAAVLGFVAFTRFFSPQYLVWVVPLVLFLPVPAWVLAAVALVLAQLWFFHYADVVALSGYVWLVLARNVAVLAVFVVAVVVLRRRTAEDEDAVLLEHEPPVGVPA